MLPSDCHISWAGEIPTTTSDCLSNLDGGVTSPGTGIASVTAQEQVFCKISWSSANSESDKVNKIKNINCTKNTTSGISSMLKTTIHSGPKSRSGVKDAVDSIWVNGISGHQKKVHTHASVHPSCHISDSVTATKSTMADHQDVASETSRSTDCTVEGLNPAVVQSGNSGAKDGASHHSHSQACECDRRCYDSNTKADSEHEHAENRDCMRSDNSLATGGIPASLVLGVAESGLNAVTLCDRELSVSRDSASPAKDFIGLKSDSVQQSIVVEGSGKSLPCPATRKESYSEVSLAMSDLSLKLTSPDNNIEATSLGQLQLVSSPLLESTSGNDTSTVPLPCTEDQVNVASQGSSGSEMRAADYSRSPGQEPESSESQWAESDSIRIDDLPVELLLRVFSFLTPPELCRWVSRVCQRWHRLSYDGSLWHHLDVSTCCLDGPGLGQLVRRVPGAIHHLVISGLPNLRVEDVFLLGHCCPDLNYLDLGFIDMLNASMLASILVACPRLAFLNMEGCRNANHSMIVELTQLAGPMLRQLNLSHCSIVDESLGLLMSKMPTLTHLNIDGISWISESVVQRLAMTYVDTLESLDLDGNELSDAAVHYVAFCHRLRTLSISFCEQLSDRTFLYLQRLKNLRRLVLRKGPVFSCGALMEFLSSTTLSQLTYLDLTECQQLEDEGVIAIGQTCGRSLRSLNLSWCWDVTDRGIGHIAGSCPEMEKMYLVGLHRLEGTWLFVAVEFMPHLHYISLEQCNEVQDGVIEETVKKKKDLSILNYYGELFVHKRG